MVVAYSNPKTGQVPSKVRHQMAQSLTASLASFLSLVKSVPGSVVTPEQEALLGAFVQYVGTSSVVPTSGGSSSTPKRPKAGTLTGQVWEVADSLVVGGKAPERKQVREACKAKGLNEATIDTQWSLWSKAFKAAAEEAAAKAAATATEQAEAGVGGA